VKDPFKTSFIPPLLSPKNSLTCNDDDDDDDDDDNDDDNKKFR
jgi:hypothetical protein